MKQLDLFEDSEIWVNIAEYGDKYQICNIGEKVRNKKGKILYTQIHSNKYYMVQLCKNGKMKLHTVHRLKAIAFVPNPENLEFVNHIDGNRVNNDISNYEWVTKKGNIKHGYLRSISENRKHNWNQRFMKDDVIRIRADFALGKRMCDIIRETGANHKTIECIIKRKTWNYDGM